MWRPQPKFTLFFCYWEHDNDKHRLTSVLASTNCANPFYVPMQLLLSWSGLSLGFWGYFYPLCLVHIIVNNDILQRVLRSVTKNCEDKLCSLLLHLYWHVADICRWYLNMHECTDSNECPLCAKNVTNAVDLLCCQYMKYVSWEKMCPEIMLLHDVIVKMEDG